MNGSIDVESERHKGSTFTVKVVVLSGLPISPGVDSSYSGNSNVVSPGREDFPRSDSQSALSPGTRTLSGNCQIFVSESNLAANSSNMGSSTTFPTIAEDLVQDLYPQATPPQHKHQHSPSSDLHRAFTASTATTDSACTLSSMVPPVSIETLQVLLVEDNR
jgi:hypothetical protein